MLSELKKEWKCAIEAELRAYLGSDDIPALTIGVPPRSELGDAAFPMFPYAKAARKAPAQIASDMKAALEGKSHPAGEMLTAGPYLNIRFDIPSLADRMLGEVEAQGDDYGRTTDRTDPSSSFWKTPISSPFMTSLRPSLYVSLS